MPDAVYVLWWITLIITVIFIPYLVYRLHKARKMAQSIYRYCSQILEAGDAISYNTENVKALGSTADLSKEIKGKAENIKEHTANLEKTLEGRAKKHKEV